MGCGISRFDPKEVVETPTNCPHRPLHNKFSYTASNCFTGESKPLVQDQGPLSEERSGKSYNSSPDREAMMGEKRMKMKVKREEVEEINNQRMKINTQTQFEENYNDDDNESDLNCREICRGGSPSFREYCIESESRSITMEDNDYLEENHCKWPNERTHNSEKEKGVDNEIGKKEGRGKRIRNTLQRVKSGGVKNFLTTSHRQQQ